MSVRTKILLAEISGEMYGYVPEDTFPEGSDWGAERTVPSPELTGSLLSDRRGGA